MDNHLPLAIQAERAAKISLCVTSVVVVVKLLAGWATGSVSVLAEATQSLVDVLIAFGVVQSVRFSARPPDEDHPYGHGRAEVLMSAFQMVLIMGSAGFIVSQAIARLKHPEPIQVDWGLAAMSFAAIANFIVSRYLLAVSKKTGSTALLGEVQHLQGDTLSSLGVLLGLILVRLTGIQQLDPICAIALMVLVVFLAIKQLRVIVHQLMDGALPPEEREILVNTLQSHPNVKGFHAIRSRTVGSNRYIDLHVLLDDNLTFVEAHDLAEEIEGELGNALGQATVSVHFEPFMHEIEHRKKAHGDLPVIKP